MTLDRESLARRSSWREERDDDMRSWARDIAPEMYVEPILGRYSDAADLRVLCDPNEGRLAYY